MARHRNDARRTRVSRAPVVAVVVVVVLVLAVFAWFKVRDSSDDAGNEAAATCVKGDSTLAVAAAPDVAPVLTDLASSYTAQRTVVRDQCVKVVVTPVAPGAALAGLSGEWNTAVDGEKPALWVPTDSTWSQRAQALSPSPVTGSPASLATSPVLLAVPAAASQAVADAGLTWRGVADLQGTEAWSRLGQPGGRFTQALPPADAAGSVTPLVAQAVVADQGGGPVTTQQVTDSAAVLGKLGAGPDPQPDSPADALQTIVGLDTVAGSSFQSVAATEQQLLAAPTGLDPITGVALTGATPTADFPLTELAGSWVDETQSRSAAAFAEYLAQNDAQARLGAAGFRVGGRAPQAPDGAVLGEVGQPLATADAATTTAALGALRTPASGTTTVLLDISGSTGATEGAATRLANTTAALRTRVDALPAGAGVGLWPFSRDLDGSLPYRIAVPTGTLTDGGFPAGTRRQAIDSALGGLRPATSTSSNFALQGAYTAAVAGYVPGRTNSVLLVTDGPNDGTTTTSDVLATIRSAGDPAKPVRVDVVVVGPGFDTSGLAQIAQASGGTLVDAGTSDSSGLTDALSRLLT